MRNTCGCDRGHNIRNIQGHKAPVAAVSIAYIRVSTPSARPYLLGGVVVVYP